ncbi:ATP-dependent 3'-5' DNA helicase, partial [Linderina pennispora]
IDKVDAGSRVALVHYADVSWYTTARDYLDVIPGSIRKSSEHGVVNYGDVEVRVTVFGYRRIDQRSRRVLELVERQSPVLTSQSLGIWITVPASAARRVAGAGLDVEASVHGAQHSVMVALAQIAGCLVQDLRTECKSPLAARSKAARLIIYEKVPFSAGPTSRAVERSQEIIGLAHQRVLGCECERGCASCVYLGSGCSEHNQCVDKAGALLILATLL